MHTLHTPHTLYTHNTDPDTTHTMHTQQAQNAHATTHPTHTRTNNTALSPPTHCHTHTHSACVLHFPASGCGCWPAQDPGAHRAQGLRLPELDAAMGTGGLPPRPLLLTQDAATLTPRAHAQGPAIPPAVGEAQQGGRYSHRQSSLGSHSVCRRDPGQCSGVWLVWGGAMWAQCLEGITGPQAPATGTSQPWTSAFPPRSPRAGP